MNRKMMELEGKEVEVKVKKPSKKRPYKEIAE